MAWLTLLVTANRVNFLSEALVSIIAQSSQDFELLCVVDNAGEPTVADVFERWQPLLPMTSRIVHVAGNGTAGRVRNAGIAEARTEWVAYLDGDDFIDPRAMASMSRVVQDSSPDVRLVSSGMVRVDRDGVPKPLAASLHYRPPTWIYDQDPDVVGHATYFNQFQAIRRNAWAEYEFDESTNGEDIDFVLHHLLLGGYRKVPEYLYFFRETPGSFSTRSFRGGDICTKRYASGYYSELCARLYGPHVAGNFSSSDKGAEGDG